MVSTGAIGPSVHPPDEAPAGLSLSSQRVRLMLITSTQRFVPRSCWVVFFFLPLSLPDRNLETSMRIHSIPSSSCSHSHPFHQSVSVPCLSFSRRGLPSKLDVVKLQTQWHMVPLLARAATSQEQQGRPQGKESRSCVAFNWKAILQSLAGDEKGRVDAARTR